MKKLIAATALLSASTIAQAEYKDVIGFEMTGDCSFDSYMAIVADFNTWAKPHGYSAQIFMPMDSDNLEMFYWVGTSKDTATFGAAYDAWMKGVGMDGSDPAKLNARFNECSENQTRRSYQAF